MSPDSTPPPNTDGAAAGSPGVVSGNLVQVPVHVPVKPGKNSISVIGLLNPEFGDVDVNS